jgi:RND family efflux transporter MFP subunit
MSSRQLWIPIGILLVGVSGVVALVKTRPQAETQPRPARTPLVRVQSVEPRPLDLIVRAHGTVVPRREGDLVPQVAGLVEWVSPALASGGFFDEDEVLLRIDRADYEVALESARAQVARADSEFDRATKELARQQRLAARSVASETNYDDATNRERIAAATLREARAILDRAERDLTRTELVAPYAGRVRQANVDVGQFVSRGASIGRIYSVDFAEVRLPIPDSELSYLDLPLVFRDSSESEQDDGPHVLLHARFAGRDHEWTGRVVRTEGEIDPRSRMVHVVARVADPYGRLSGAGSSRDRPPLAVGLFVEAEIRGRRLESVVELPRVALRDGRQVLVVDEALRMHRRAVQVLRIESDRVLIGEGLERGERVVVSPIRAVVEGMAVRILEAEREAHAATDESPSTKKDAS